MMSEHPDIHLDLHKDRIREFYREAEHKRLIREARKAQSRPIRTTLTQGGSFFRWFIWKLRMGLSLGRAPEKKQRDTQDQTAVGSTQLGR